MKQLINKKSTIAILFACAWALFAMCIFAAVRPIKEAHAEEEEYGTVTIKALNTKWLGMFVDNIQDWAVFYLGTELLTEAKWKTDETEGTVEFGIDESGDYIITAVYDLEKEELSRFGGDIADTPSPFVTEDTHKFTSGAGNKDWESTDNGHYAVCDCGLMLEVAHRPDGDGGCMDCDAAVTGYDDTYSFEIPDSVEFSEESLTAEVSVGVKDVKIFTGHTLKLNLQCTDFISTSDSDVSFTYTIEVTYDGPGEVASYSSEEIYDSQTIWEFVANDYLGDDGMWAVIDSEETITITLSIDTLYAGEFTAELTFSAEITWDNEEA